jgi:ligand-binding sensor domain-containing protein
MKYFIVALEILTVLLSGTTALCEAKSPAGELPTTSSASVTEQRLPYVYTKWKHFTVKDGLPNDHVFAIKADSARAWIGTENGLACIDKKTGKIKSWKEEDGLPWRVVSSLDINPKTSELWIGFLPDSAAAASTTGTSLTAD